MIALKLELCDKNLTKFLEKNTLVKFEQLSFFKQVSLQTIIFCNILRI